VLSLDSGSCFLVLLLRKFCPPVPEAVLLTTPQMLLMSSSHPLICGFGFLSFSYPWSTAVENIKWKIPETNDLKVLNCAVFK
jgi:hypothetical protein